MTPQNWFGWYWQADAWHRACNDPYLEACAHALTAITDPLGILDKDTLLNHGGYPAEQPLWRRPLLSAAR